MSLRIKEIFEFGPFRLDVDEHSIERIDGHANGSLTEKAFRVLVLLVLRRGHLVSKDELISFVWPDTIVEDNNLEKCVHHLRNFLGETPDGKKYIETIRKHGYRFVGNVEAIEVSTSWLPETFRNGDGHGLPASAPLDAMIGPAVEELFPAAPAPAVKRRDPVRSAIIFSAIVLASMAAMGVGLFLFVRSGPVADGRRSIAVLPLRPIDPANRNDLYEVGIADSLIHQLNGVDGLVVRPLSAVRKYTDVALDPLAVAREQKVDYVLSSGYQIANGRIKVTSQFVNAATGNVEDTFTVAADAGNLFSAQDTIAEDIGRRLRARFGAAAAGAPTKGGTGNADAYRLYMMAMNLSEERGTPKVLKSLEYLDRAVALDPNYAAAWAAKAHIHRDIATSTNADQHEQYQLSMDAISRALAVDPDLSDAYSALCHNKNRYEYDPVAAEAACKRALQLDPDSPIAHKTYSNFLYSRGRFSESIAEIKTAMDLQPVSFRNQQIYGLALYYAQNYPAAEAQFKHIIELNPNHSHIHKRLIMALEQQGKEAEAFEYFIEMLVINKAAEATVERYKNAYRTSGWRGVTIERAREAAAGTDEPAFQIGCLYASIGDKDKAFEYLEKAYRERSHLISVLQVEPHLEPLHSDPRFGAILARLDIKPGR